MLSCGNERQGLLSAQSKHDHDVKDPALGMGFGTGLRRVGVSGEAREVAASAKVMVRRCMVKMLLSLAEVKMVMLEVMELGEFC